MFYCLKIMLTPIRSPLTRARPVTQMNHESLGSVGAIR